MSFLIFAILILCVHEISSSTAKEKECIRKLLDWCKKNDYSSEEEDNGGSVSMYTTTINGKHVSLYCTTDHDGTECLKDKKPWYHCQPDNTVLYEGEPLDHDSDGGNDVCAAKDHALGSGINVKFNSNAFHQGMNMFRNQMSGFGRNLNRGLRNLNHRLNRPGFPFNWFSSLDDYDY